MTTSTPSKILISGLAIVVIAAALLILRNEHGTAASSTTPSPTPPAEVSASPTAATPTPTTAPLTSEQIFNEATRQLKLDTKKLTSFRIYGQDRIQFGFGSGTNFAYKVNGIWKQSGHSNAQSLELCSNISEVPVQFRQPCSETNSNSSPTHYLEADRTSTNYPPSEAVFYVPE